MLLICDKPNVDFPDFYFDSETDCIMCLSFMSFMYICERNACDLKSGADTDKVSLG